MNKRTLLNDILSKVGNTDIGFSLYLVKMGARQACLIEFSGVDDVIGNNSIQVAKSLGLRTAWENKEFKRVLVSKKSLPIKEFQAALVDETQLGKLLGFQCAGDMGERFSVDLLAQWG